MRLGIFAKSLILSSLVISCDPAYSNSGTITKHRIIDGDTIEASVSLGFGISIKQKFRMARYNSPEIFSGKRKKLGYRSKYKLSDILDTKKQIKVIAKHKGKYGRWISEIFVDGENVNDMMILFEEGNK